MPAEKKTKIPANEVRIEKLNKKHDLSSFKSYEQELVDFLNEDSLHNQEQNISATFLWFHKDKLASYIALLTDKINLEGNLKEFFREKEIHYKSLPALKVGRICTDDDCRGKGLGRLMILFVIQKIREINQDKAGCRFITVDAKRNPKKELDSIHFYKKLGFKVLKKRKKGTTPMYLDLKLN